MLDKDKKTIKMNDVEKRNDEYALRSATHLKIIQAKFAKTIFTGALKCIEIKFGKDFNGWEAIRAEILRTGNDAIRNFSKVIDEKFNIEEIPQVISYKKGKEK